MRYRNIGGQMKVPQLKPDIIMPDANERLLSKYSWTVMTDPVPVDWKPQPEKNEVKTTYSATRKKSEPL